MESARNKQSGFSALEAVLAIAVVAVIGVTGWFVYQHNRTQATDAASNPNQQTTTTTPPAPTVTYLDIKEWGVKLPLSDSIKDAYYVTSTVNANDPDGLPSTVWLGLKSLTASNCNPDNNNHGSTGAVGAILRVPSDYRDPVEPHPLYTEKYPNGIIIGSYYYAYQSWKTNNACISQDAFTSIDSAFGTATKSTAATSTTAN